MNKVKVLVEGYANKLKLRDSYKVNCTITLIKSNNKKIIVDPGCHKEELLSALKKEGLKPEDIDYVAITHLHMDHCLLAGLFENARVLDDDTIYTFAGTEDPYAGKIPETNIEVIPVPGHDQFHSALVVRNTDKGTIVVAGDVFWWREDQKQETDRASLLSHKDPFVKNQEQLDASRKKVLKLADFVIPGHGKMFEVKK